MVLYSQEETIALPTEELEKRFQELDQYLDDIQEQIDSMSYYNKAEVKFFYDHVSMYKKRLCLYKRVDYKWMVNLRKKGVITKCKEDGVYYLKSEIELAWEYERRRKRKWRVYYTKKHASDFFGPPPEAQLYDNDGNRIANIFQHREDIGDEYWDVRLELEERQKQEV